MHENDSPPPGQRRILVADDNKDLADSVATLLRIAGHDVRVMYSGREVLEISDAFRPHVAVLDLGMPAVSGYETAQQLRARSYGAELLLIALSGWGEAGDRQRSTAAGFDHHLTKPADFARLNDLITGWQGRRL